MKSYNNYIIFIAAAALGFLLCGGCIQQPKAEDLTNNKVETVITGNYISVHRVQGHTYLSYTSGGLVHAQHCGCFTNQ